MQNFDVDKTVQAWRSLEPPLFVPHNEEEYENIVAMLDMIIDEVGEDESHPLASLMEVMGVLVQTYEDRHLPELVNE